MGSLLKSYESGCSGLGGPPHPAPLRNEVTLSPYEFSIPSKNFNSRDDHAGIPSEGSALVKKEQSLVGPPGLVSNTSRTAQIASQVAPGASSRLRTGRGEMLAHAGAGNSWSSAYGPVPKLEAHIWPQPQVAVALSRWAEAATEAQQRGEASRLPPVSNK
jgi:hypothetical protein